MYVNITGMERGRFYMNDNVMYDRTIKLKNT